MIEINLSNIEKIIFSNEALKKKIPEFVPYFEQWNLAKNFSFLKQMGKQAVLDVLSNLNERHEEIISDFFNDFITINKTYSKSIDFCDCNLNDYDLCLNKLNGNLFIHRNKDKIFLGVWR